MDPIFVGEGYYEHEVPIVLEGSHWNGMKGIREYFPINHYYCPDCKCLFHTKEEHGVTCLTKCTFCGEMGKGPCPNNIDRINCKNCGKLV